jgi:hypothetical protein
MQWARSEALVPLRGAKHVVGVVASRPTDNRLAKGDAAVEEEEAWEREEERVKSSGRQRIRQPARLQSHPLQMSHLPREMMGIRARKW